MGQVWGFLTSVGPAEEKFQDLSNPTMPTSSSRSSTGGYRRSMFWGPPRCRPCSADSMCPVRAARHNQLWGFVASTATMILCMSDT